MTPDTINACFEGGGALLLCLNVRRLLRDRSVKGVSLWTSAFWLTWNLWNVYFYHVVRTPVSMWAGVAMAIVNAAWLVLALHYASADERASRRQFESAMGGRPYPTPLTPGCYPCAVNAIWRFAGACNDCRDRARVRNARKEGQL